MAVIVWTCVMLVLSVHLVAPSKECPKLSTDNKATYNITKDTYTDKETVSYVCNVGFRLKGSKSELLCVNGTWKPKSVECKQIKCKKLTIPNASLNTGRQKFNTQVNIRCQEGYNIKGPNVITCGGQGVWIPAPPTCEKVIPVKVTCPPPAVPNSSGQDGYKAEYEVGERAAISCQKGYRLIGSSQITCLEGGQWEELPNCRLVEGRCPPPPYVPNAHTEHNNQTDYEANTTLRLKCNHGYRMARGPSTISCRDGQWTDVQLMCEKKKCGSAGEVENGRYHYTGSSFGDVATARCFEGYQLIGVGVRHCTNNGWDGRVAVCEGQGVWIPALPTCEKVIPVQVTCPPPAVPNSRGQDGYKAEYKVGERAAISCQKGYRLIGSSQITCLEDGQWEELPNCRLVEGRCPPPPYVPNAHTEHNDQTDYEPNTTLRLKCNLGYRMARGPSTISCRDGQWTDVQLMCEKKKCGSAGEVENGRYHYTGSSFGDVATARCFEGYQLIGVGVRHCTSNGWDGRVAVCEANQCPDPPEVPDADVNVGTSGIIKPGYVASYSCRLGTLIGESEIVCTEDGTWSREAPRCNVVSCPAPNIQYGFIFSGVRRQYNSGLSVMIKCNPGWRLLGSSVSKCGADGEWRPRLPKCACNNE